MAGTKTPLSRQLLDSVMGPLRSLIGWGGNSDIGGSPMPALTDAPFAPGRPVAPTMASQDGAPLDARRFDYPTGWNQTTTPRQETSINRPRNLSASDLRLMARSYGLLRTAIETRKNQVLGQAHTIRGREGANVLDDSARLIAARTLFNKPDGRRDFDSFMKVLLEDLMVLDFISVRIDQNVGGQVIAFRPIDGGTIKLVLDIDGESPLPEEGPAYCQIIKGMPWTFYTTNEMICRSFYPAIDLPYGFSPVEQIADIISLGIRRQQHQLNFFTEGNLPEALVLAPEGWDKVAVAKFQLYWDTLFEGPNALSLKRKTRFLEHGMEVLQQKDPQLKDELDDWLARQICFAFNISPSALTKDNNRSVGETIHEQNQREGLEPLLNFLKTFFDDMLVAAGFPEMEFAWAEEDSVDPLERAQVDQIYANIGAKTVNEIRHGIGLGPIDGGDVASPKQPTPFGGGFGGGPGGGGVGDLNSFMSIFGKGDRGYGRLSAKRAKSGSQKKKAAAPTIDRARPVVVAQAQAILLMFQRAFRRYLGEVQAQLKSRGKAIGSGYVPPKMSWTTDESAALMDALALIASDGVAAAAQQLVQMGFGSVAADVKDEANQAAIAYARLMGGDLVTQVSDTTRDMVGDVVADGLEDGWTNEEIASALQDGYAFSDERALTIARTETAYADVAGNIQTYRKAGVQKKRWLLGSNSCDVCQENADAGDIPMEENFPSGAYSPPEHPNCTCDLLPVFDDDDQEDDE